MPRIAYVNKMDINGANFFNVIEMMKTRLHAHPVAIQIPIGKEDTFQGMIDLVTMKAEIYKDDLGNVIEETDIPAEYKNQADEYRATLMEAVAETDDAMMERYFAGETFTVDEIRAAIRKATLAMTMNPVCCGSSYKNKGVQKLLDAIVYYLPSPVDIAHVKGTLPDSDVEEESCVQDRSRSVRRQARVLPLLQRRMSRRLLCAQLDKGQEGARRARPFDARQFAYRYRGDPRRRYLRDSRT